MPDAVVVRCPFRHDPCPCLGDPMPPDAPPGCTDSGCEPIHFHFGLSYASYLVLPRSVLQSMPKRWQSQFVALLKELGRAWEGEEESYRVQYGRWVDGDDPDEPGAQEFVEMPDDLGDYQRGRRRIPLNIDLES